MGETHAHPQSPRRVGFTHPTVDKICAVMYIPPHIPHPKATPMTRLLTTHIATMTEMREPHKVLERANGQPVAILKNSAVIGYMVPIDAVSQHTTRNATLEEVMASIEKRRHINQPVLDYLKDK